MNALVGYASEHGSTAGIAERIAENLRGAGIAAEATALHAVTDASRYDAFVLGSAVHGGRWLPEAAEFMNRSGQAINGRPAWLVSVSSLGDQSSVFGTRVSRFLRRRRKVPPEIINFAAAMAIQDHHNFAGSIAKHDYGTAGRLFMFLVGGRFGDHRNWDEVDAWAQEIARAVAVMAPTGTAA